MASIRWSWASLEFSLSDRKLVVARAHRPDLAHLTLSWGNASGEIDLHLTRNHEAAMSADGRKAWHRIFAVPGSVVGGAGLAFMHEIENEFVPRLVCEYRRYRPGWLSRNGYVVMLPDEAGYLELFREAAPRLRGKYRITPSVVFDEHRLEDIAVDGLYDPRALRFVDGRDLRTPVIAVQVHRGRVIDATRLCLSYRTFPNGEENWWGFRLRFINAFGHDACRQIFEWLVPRVGPRHLAEFDNVVTAMGLDEVPELQDFVRSGREFLRAPANPVPARASGCLAAGSARA